MNLRRPSVASMLVAGALGAVLAGALFAQSSEPAQAVGPYSFPHKPHLSNKGIAKALRMTLGKGGAGRQPDAECRVCHDFTKGPEPHLVGCDQCHIDSAHLEVVKTPSTTGRRPFPHAAHLRAPGTTCFDCHAAELEADWIEFTVPAPGLDAKGGAVTKSCADCHAEHEPQGGKVSQDDVTGDGKPCATCHTSPGSILPRSRRGLMSRRGIRPFLHGDHGGSSARCDDCHSGVRASETIWDYDPTEGTADACVKCHVSDASGTPLVQLGSPPRTSKVPFVAFEKFPHKDHLLQPGRVPVTGNVNGCQTCHYPETDPSAAGRFPGRTPSSEPLGRDALIEYRTCVPCHEDWQVEQHGVGAWACFKCHAGEVEDDGMLAMATADVQREHLANVTFHVHLHPGVTTEGAVLVDSTQTDGKTCADCHLAENESLPSRIKDRPFSHDAHVRDEDGGAGCVACHPGVANTSWSQDLERFSSHGDPTGTGAAGQGCLDCHVGARPEDLGVTAKERRVAEFDHRSHVASKEIGGAPGSASNCTECHEKGGDVGYTTPADVVDCTRCHTHDESRPEAFARTGPAATKTEAKRCGYCHGEDFADVTGGDGRTAPARREHTRVHLDLLPGKQWHDRSGACAECHERDRFAGQPGRYQERITRAKVNVSIHDDPAFARRWFNDPRLAKPGGDPEGRGRTCMTCHRREPRGYLKALSK